MAASNLRTNPKRFPLASAPILGAIVVLILMAVSIARHPTALQDSGSSLLWQDFAFLLAYALAALWAMRPRSHKLHLAIRVGSIAGSLLGAVLVANHVTELFVPDRNFALVIAPVFVALALFAAAGSATRERTGSLLLAMAAGACCAMVGVLILLCIGFALTLACEARAELWLRDAFAASGATDPGAYLVQNTLQAASEGLLRMPVFALFPSLLGALANAWIARRSQTFVLVLFCSAIVGFLAGAAALWYANSLPRAARPPFIAPGLLLVCLALSTAHPAWSALRHRRQ
ncbi:MAG TPA: hypothetical protein VG267_19920 [Terracidiphilus sp.]|jgi:hypothetical protein|nr:hypothetical protein [Terracidiphilus sp.]